MKKMLIFLALFVIVPSSSAAAHSGRTDSSGGHNCRVGECAGTYHYHNGGGATPPASQTPRFVAPPRVPVVRTKIETRTEAVPFKKTVRYDYRVYSGKIIKQQTGKSGKRVITSTITLTDGKETGRADSKSEVVMQAENEVVVMGGRTQSEARFYGIAQAPKNWFGSNKNKYNIWGKFKPDSEVSMTVNGKNSKTVRTDSEGWFTFEKINITENYVWLHLFEKINNNSKSVSEKTRVDLETKKLVTEYDLIHIK